MEKRSELLKKKKNKGRKNFFLIFLFLLIAGAGYFVYQYNNGVSMANEDTASNSEKDTRFEQFQGAEAQFGEINVLLIGNDARADEEEARSDALMIGHYNQDTNEVKLVSLMRDTYVEVPEYGMQKLNAAFFLGGPELVRKTIKQNFDVDVQYYAIVNFEGFSKIVDVIAPDGIEVDIPYPMSHGINMTLEPGEQHLNGDQLLGYVRFRHDIHSDFGRVKRQQEALSKLKDEAISMNTLFNLPKLLGVIDPYIDTNVDGKTLFTIGKGMLTGGKSKDLETMRIPAEGTYKDLRVRAGEVLDINREENKRLLKEFLSDANQNNQDESTVTEREE
ncbi:LCP family protein [Sporosarcina sp.]|uniref:LCP family protein n=1 Tax=Sporosarcina sp. TaxID=49982 RepID=UPI00260FE8D3|nr:LCP family protein [Sporosarcina sp.]